MTTAASHAQGLGEENSIWFKLAPLLRGDPENPMRILMHMTDRYGPVIPVNLANQRIVFISEPEYFKHVLVTKVDNYVKYFDGLKPIFGKSMITNDGALWQKIRMPQQPAFHPDMFAEYIPYFIKAIQAKMDIWAKLAKSGETFEMVEQTWTLAADMICKALFDRDMPFNPHVVFKCVKTYTISACACRRVKCSNSARKTLPRLLKPGSAYLPQSLPPIRARIVNARC
jgi:cytochrome P450